MTLGPLDEHTVADLVEDRLGLPPGPGLQSLVANAGGNPFYVAELIEALAVDGRLRTTDGAVEADVTSTPVAFRTAIVRYVRFLGEPQLALLRWAAVLGSRFSPTDLASVSGTAVSDLLPVLDDAARAGILIDDRGRLAFRHELLRSALYDDMGTAIRRSMHLEAARALAARSASPLQVAHHILRTSATSDDFAIETLLAAAHQTIHLGGKIELLTAALQRLPTQDSRSVDVAVKTIVLLGLTGRGADAEGLAARMQPTLNVRERARLSAALAAAYANQGDSAATLRHCDAIRDRTLLPPRERNRLLINEGFALYGALRVDDAETMARRAIEEATTSSDHETVATGRGLLCFCTLARGHGRDAAAMAFDVAKTWTGQGEFTLEMALINEDRFAEAEELFAAAHEAVAERGHLTVQLQFQAANARVALLAGRLDDAEARSEAALSLAEHADVHVPTAIARGVLGRVALHRGSITDAKAAIGSDEPVPGLGVDVAEWVRALILDAQGDPGEARRTLAAAWDRLEPVRYFGTWPSIGSDLVRLHLRAGDRTGAANGDERDRDRRGRLRRSLCLGRGALLPGTARTRPAADPPSRVDLRGRPAHPRNGQGEGGRRQPSQWHRSHRPATNGAGNLRESRRHGRHHASAIRAAPPRGQPRHTRSPPASADRLEEPHPRGATSGRPRRRRTHHAPDRRPPAHLQLHRRQPPPPRVPEARHQLPRPTHKACHQPRSRPQLVARAPSARFQRCRRRSTSRLACERPPASGRTRRHRRVCLADQGR